MNRTQAIQTVLNKVTDADCPEGVRIGRLEDHGMTGVKRQVFIEGLRAAFVTSYDAEDSIVLFNDFDPDLIEKLILKIADRVVTRMERQRNALAKIVEKME